MATAKKKEVKVRDLKPSKDAKGGVARNMQSSSRHSADGASRQRTNTNTSRNLL